MRETGLILVCARHTRLYYIRYRPHLLGTFCQTEMADSSARQTTRTSPSRSRRSHSETLVARRTGSSHRASPYHNPAVTRNVSAIDRQRAIAHQWSWLPTTIATWRMEEDIEIPADVGRYSVMDLSPYTQEPTHFTVPVLAVRVNRHERQLRNMNIELQETRENWRLTAMERINQVSEDHENTVDNMDILHTQLIETRNEVATLRLRLEQSEQRSHEAEQYSRMLEQRLTLAEENARQASSLAEAVDHLITLLPQVNLRQD